MGCSPATLDQVRYRLVEAGGPASRPSAWWASTAQQFEFILCPANKFPALPHGAMYDAVSEFEPFASGADGGEFVVKTFLYSI